MIQPGRDWMERFVLSVILMRPVTPARRLLWRALPMIMRAYALFGVAPHTSDADRDQVGNPYILPLVAAIARTPCNMWKVCQRGFGVTWGLARGAIADAVAGPVRWGATLAAWVRGPWGQRIAIAGLLVCLSVRGATGAHGVLVVGLLSSTTLWEVEATGDDTNNGGAFDPGQTAGMFTDGAATSANTASPVFTSASYNFVAGDVGAWLFIGAGTNWTKGWYKIASVASNAATLSAAIGAAVQSSGATTSPIVPSTVIGCATTASPTGATWSIDYSQQASARFTYTDLASAGAGLTVSSAAKPFAKQHVGNSIVITGGTNFTAGRYVIASVAATVATVVGPGNITTGAGASGTGGLGGALASPGLPGGVMVSHNQVFVKTGSYTVASAST